VSREKKEKAGTPPLPITKKKRYGGTERKKKNERELRFFFLNNKRKQGKQKLWGSWLVGFAFRLFLRCRHRAPTKRGAGVYSGIF
jgi:hypothetical protein